MKENSASGFGCEITDMPQNHSAWGGFMPSRRVAYSQRSWCLPGLGLRISLSRNKAVIIQWWHHRLAPPLYLNKLSFHCVMEDSSFHLGLSMQARTRSVRFFHVTFHFWWRFYPRNPDSSFSCEMSSREDSRVITKSWGFSPRRPQNVSPNPFQLVEICSIIK